MTPEQARTDIADIIATRAEFWERIWIMASAGYKPPGIGGPPTLSQHQRFMLGASLGERKARHIQQEMREGRGLREQARGSGWVVRNS
jgi:hypothetical protein